MTRKRELWLIAGLFLASLVVSMVFWSVLPAGYRENQSTDYQFFYEPVARAIAAGQGITLDGEMAVRYPPGFPALLAGVFRMADVTGVADDSLLLAFRLLCVGLSVLLVYGLARLVWSPWLALIPAVAWMTYPFQLWLTKQPNSEVPFIPALYGALFLFWWAVLRGRGGPRTWLVYLAAGALAGGAMLIRPAALGMSAAMALVVLLFAMPGVALRSRLAYGGLVVLGSLLAVLPWETAVFSRTGQIIPLSAGGAATIHDGFTFLAVPKDYRQEVDIPEDVADLMWAIHERRLETATTGGVVTVVAEEARAAPLAFVKLMLIKLARSWYGIDSRVMEMPTLALQVIYLILSVWGGIYAWRQGGALRRMTGGNWLIVLYFWAMTFIVIPLLRYMAPVMGLLMLALPGVYLSLSLRWKRRSALPVDVVTPDY